MALLLHNRRSNSDRVPGPLRTTIIRHLRALDDWRHTAYGACHSNSGKTRQRNGVAEPFRAASVSERTVRSLTVAALYPIVEAMPLLSELRIRRKGEWDSISGLSGPAAAK